MYFLFMHIVHSEMQNTVQSLVVWQSILLQFEVLADEWYKEWDDDTGQDEHQKDGNSWVLHI